MSSFLDTLHGHPHSPPPLWLMRQAGRYLPEYRARRAEVGSFLNLVYSPKDAADVTWQPIRRFGFDAAILFSDILVVPHAMGIPLTFENGEGPHLRPVQTTYDLETYTANDPSIVWSPVMETLRKLKNIRSQSTMHHPAIIGFAGAPWTVACYMIQGHGKDHHFSSVLDSAQNNPAFFNTLINHITITTISYLCAQIEAGAEVIQIFDSWASLTTKVSKDHLFNRYVIEPTARIISDIKDLYPSVPVIGFARGVGDHTTTYVQETNIDVVQCGPEIDLKKLRNKIGPNIATQGNLDPIILLKGGDILNQAIKDILEATAGTPHIFNLGHGILPETPIEHVEQLVKHVRGT